MAGETVGLAACLCKVPSCLALHSAHSPSVSEEPPQAHFRCNITPWLGRNAVIRATCCGLCSMRKTAWLPCVLCIPAKVWRRCASGEAPEATPFTLLDE